MADEQKKRHVVSYEKMAAEVAAAFAEKYPQGFNDYFQDLIKYPKPDGTFFYAVTIEIGDDVYLVKIQVKTDDLDEVEKWLDEDEVSEQADASEDAPGDNTLPDDNISQYGGDEDSSDA
ncbi:MAG: hypothetical protein MJY45_01415 [Bacteroidales bacterium]|nr:hypothetical protein [Bacteroidales bacterium]